MKEEINMQQDIEIKLERTNKGRIVVKTKEAYLPTKVVQEILDQAISAVVQAITNTDVEEAATIIHLLKREITVLRISLGVAITGVIIIVLKMKGII